MAVFYIHQWCGDEYLEDTEGYTLANLGAARTEAIEGARSLLGEEARHGGFNLDQRFEITDAAGAHRLTIFFEDVVKINRCSNVIELRACTSD